MRINPTGQTETSTPTGGISLNRGTSSPTPAANTGGTISLSKGQKVSLSKGNPTLDQLHVGLGWDTNRYEGGAFDLDASVFMVGENELVPNNSFFVFYGQASSPEGSVVHSGDNLTGEGSGDDESVTVSLSTVPQEVQKLVFTVTIHEAQIRRQNFGQVSNAYIRVEDKATGKELIRYDLGEDFSTETSLVVGEIYRHNGEWKFNAVGAGYNTDLASFCKKYGVKIG